MNDVRKPTWRLSPPPVPPRWVECPVDGCSTICKASRAALTGHISDKHPNVLVRFPTDTARMVDACVGGAR